MGLGSAELFSLQEAREAARDAHRQLARGEDPIDARRAERAKQAAEADGTLPPPAPLTANGKAAAWWGWQLIQYIDQRLALAQAREAKRVPPKPRSRLSEAPPKATAKTQKRKLRR
jgi:hypothetical protein